ncbi:MAG: hypothetical protein P9F75_07395 [Candidatus Contendobacter sp.]|nr:hypothetical protein [Candidatus Contendobacter sp.]
MNKLRELTDMVNAVNSQLLKAHAEIIERINALERALFEVELPEEAVAALVDLKAMAQALDNLNPDAPPAPVDDPVAEEPEFPA